MAKSTDLQLQQNATFFRRVQVILIGVVAVSAIEYSAKQADQLQAIRATQRLAKTSVQRKSKVQPVASSQAKPDTKLQKAAILKSVKAISNQ